MSNIQSLSVNKKIAIVLSQYPQISHKVLSFFEKDEQHEILKELASAQGMKKEVIDEVINDFLDFYVNNAISICGGADVVKNILIDMYGEAAANDMLAQILSNIDGVPLQSLKKIDNESLINFVRGAHPQIIATLLCYLNDTAKSAIILASIDKSIQKKVINGMASMENGRISDEMLNALEQFVDKTFSSSMYSKGAGSKIGGINTVVQVMNSVDMNTEKNIMTSLEKDNPTLAEEIKKKMFVFDDFIKLADRDIQLVLREVVNDDQIAMCLRYCSEGIREELQEKFLRNMSKRKADIVKEAIEMLVRVKMKDLDDARQSITSIAKKLHEKGDISLGNTGDEYAE